MSDPNRLHEDGYRLVDDQGEQVGTKSSVNGLYYNQQDEIIGHENHGVVINDRHMEVEREDERDARG